MSPKRVFIFVVLFFCLYLTWSISAIWLGMSTGPWQNINLVSDFLHTSDSTQTVSSVSNSVNKDSVDRSSSNTASIARSFQLYTNGKIITRFSVDTTEPALPIFAKQLHDLKTGKKRKVRIAYFGDSMIEGDLLTQTLRKSLQQTFGGSGVGFIPIKSVSSRFRITAVSKTNGNWDDQTFLDKKKNLFFAGHVFYGQDAHFICHNQVITDSSLPLEKSLLYGTLSHESHISYNGRLISLPLTTGFRRLKMAVDHENQFTLSVNDSELPIYGVTIEPESGVIVDNFSFRGITGVELNSIDSSMLHAINRENPYDLIIFQYGVNLLFRPNDKNYSWYARMMDPIFDRFKRIFTDSDFLVISTADRAFRYNGTYASAIGIDSLVATQAQLAYNHRLAFYNLYQTMGGKNSIVDWANREPSLANRDYVHPNHRGAEILAGYLYESLKRDYEKYVARLTNTTSTH